MTSRDELPRLFAERGYTEAAEVGVQRGAFSNVILSAWGGTLHMIDRWRQVEGYDDISNVTDDEHARRMAAAIAVSKRHGGRGVIIRKDSIAAATGFADASLDAVYLDADHSKRGVLADLAAWVPKVRPGGVIAGHDYLDGVRREGEFGVKSAVLEFFGREPDVVTTEAHVLPHERWPSWLYEVA